MFQLEKNGPIVAARMRNCAPVAKFAVVTCSYGGGNRVWAHRTLRAAYRTLASVCGGKRKVRDEFAAAIVTPQGQVVTYYEAREML